MKRLFYAMSLILVICIILSTLSGCNATSKTDNSVTDDSRLENLPDQGSDGHPGETSDSDIGGDTKPNSTMDSDDKSSDNVDNLPKEEKIEEKAKNAMQNLEIWDGRTAESFGGGHGTMEEPYRINNARQLAKLARDTNSGVDFSGIYFELTSDILLNDISQWNFNSTGDQSSIDNWQTWMPIGNPDYRNTRFTGSFDGNGHTIWGLYNTRGYANSGGYIGGVGLFGCVDGTVSNINVACVYLTPVAEYIGGIVGNLYSGTISNCHVEQAIIKTDFSFCVGGICGDMSGNSGCWIADSTMEGIIACHKNNVMFHGVDGLNVGGIAGRSFGYQDDGGVFNCFSDCDMTVYSYTEVDDPDETRGGGVFINVGGISGYCANLTNCYSKFTMNVECEIHADKEIKRDLDASVGGLAGSCSGGIENCGAYGTIERTGTNLTIYAGGIVGSLVGDRERPVGISSSYSNVKDVGDSQYDTMGGIARKATYDGGDISITDCYYSNAQPGSFGLYSPPFGVFMNMVESLPESELKNKDNFVNWDFIMDWCQNDNINDGFPVPTTITGFFD